MSGRPTIVLVAAMARGNVIGADGGMPWHLPDDLRRFKELTLGHPMVMGRRTFDSIGRPLPGRTSIVITRDPDWARQGVLTATSLAAAVEIAASRSDEVMVIGGGQIYAAALPLAERLEITHIDRTVDGDTWFPPIPAAEWTVTAEERHDGYRFTTYRRATEASPGSRVRVSDDQERAAGAGPE